MIKRTIKVLGWGVSSQQSQLTVTLDGETVFNGIVPLQEMTSDNDRIETAPTLFSFEVPMEFSGTARMQIVKDRATIRFGNIVANYTLLVHAGVGIESGPFEFLDAAPLDDQGVRDPRANVVINGQLQIPARNDQLYGTWHWIIGPTDTFEHDLVISPSYD